MTAATPNAAALALSILIKMFNDDGYIDIYDRGWTWDGYTDTLTPDEVGLLRRLDAARRDEEGNLL